MRSEQSLSFDSSLKVSNSVNYASVEGIYNYKRKIKIISKIALIASCIIVSIAFPTQWIVFRLKTFSIFYSLSEQYVKNQLLEISTLAQQILTEARRIAQFTALISEGDDYLKCTPSTVLYYLTFHRFMYVLTNNAYSTYFLASNGSFCLFTGFGSNFSFFYLLPNKEIRLYDQDTHYYNWDPNSTGIPIARINSFEDFYSSIHQNNVDFFWSNLSFFNPYGNSNYVASVYPYNNGRDISTTTGVGLSFITTYLYLTTSFPNIYFAINIGGNAESSRIEDSTFLYPTLTSTESDIWKSVDTFYSKLNNETGTIIKHNETNYIAMKETVTLGNGYLTFVVLYSRDRNVRDAGALIFIISVIILLIVFIIGITLTKIINRKSKKKLEARMSIIADNQQAKNSTFNSGVLGRSIDQIHQLQLLFPQESLLNKSLDNAVINLTETSDKLFSIYQDDEYKNNIFKDIFKKKETPKDETEIPYYTWLYLTSPAFLEKKLELNWNQIETDSHRFLVKFFLNLITRNKLIFKEIDPDLFVRFLINFTSTYLKHYIHTIMMLHSLNSLLSNQFDGWILNKIDLFILFFAALIHDAKNPNQSKVNNVFIDDYSLFDEKIDSALGFFAKFIPQPKSEFKTYFFETVKDVLLDAQEFNQLQLLGRFKNRIESPNFSVHENVYDRHLFMKSILTLCNYSYYWSSNEEMLKVVREIKEDLFSKTDAKDISFVRTYFYEVASKIVQPWLRLFENFCRIEDAQDNLNKNTYFWEYKMKHVVIAMPPIKAESNNPQIRHNKITPRNYRNSFNAKRKVRIDPRGQSAESGNTETSDEETLIAEFYK